MVWYCCSKPKISRNNPNYYFINYFINILHYIILFIFLFIISSILQQTQSPPPEPTQPKHTHCMAQHTWVCRSRGNNWNRPSRTDRADRSEHSLSHLGALLLLLLHTTCCCCCCQFAVNDSSAGNAAGAVASTNHPSGSLPTAAVDYCCSSVLLLFIPLLLPFKLLLPAASRLKHWQQLQSPNPQPLPQDCPTLLKAHLLTQ
jgi:hypothetical protein